MEDIRLLIGYIEWAIIIVLTLGFFSYFSRKYTKVGSLIPLVLVSTWIIIAIIKGLEYLYFDSSSELLSFRGFAMLLAETLPILVLIGGITFAIKYIRFRKKIN
ncbi:MAG: hypothetical protein KAT68_19650 [Bacteroidales bacterium]|jgi:hypothetical protein|nr:hypothetical protein [Bacteroidales bacterium]